MKYINFAKNWNNKLDCDYFTTIRNYNRVSYYQDMIHKTVNIFLKKKLYCRETVVAVETWDTPELSIHIGVLDTGILNYEELLVKFGLKDKCCLILLKREPPGELRNPRS